MAYDAVLRNLAVIGEAVRALRRETRDRLPDVPWASTPDGLVITRCLAAQTPGLDRLGVQSARMSRMLPQMYPTVIPVAGSPAPQPSAQPGRPSTTSAITPAVSPPAAKPKKSSPFLVKST